MTHRQDRPARRDVAARWCALAEQRLDHLTEMFETGRWRRYHSEIAFLENIQEAKRAVLIWRALAEGTAVPPMEPPGSIALGWSPGAASQGLAARDQTVQPKAVHIAQETTIAVDLPAMPDLLADMTEVPIAPRREPPPDHRTEFTLSLDGIEARYPLLRNAF
jgi:uncharacterized repeat protein (TIGR03809 family)